MNLTIPELSLVLLVGPSGCGKSTFARQHFRTSEIVSSDFYRGVVCDDEANQAASPDAFDLLHEVVARRLVWKRFTVVDATNLQPNGRKPLIELARRYHYLLGAIVFDFPEEVCQKHNALRAGRSVPARVVTNHTKQMRRVPEMLEREGIRPLHVFRSPEELAGVTVRRVPLWVDRRDEHGPFDIIGDVHGCIEELLELFGRLDYRFIHQPDSRGLPGVAVEPPPGRKAVFVGDLGDRGPDTPAVYRLVMPLVRAGHALCVMGNHDSKLLRKLRGNDVQMSHGLADTMEQLAKEPPELVEEIRSFLERLVTHYVLDDGKLVVAHAGLREDLQGRDSARVRSFALFGDTTGETDEFGLPVRLNWAADYRGRALVVYGHTPVAEPVWINNTINIDTGCVFGGRLGALRYPEREIVSVSSHRQYSESARPFLPARDAPPAPGATARPPADDGIDLAGLRQKMAVETRLLGWVNLAEGSRLAALEEMSRCATNPRWLIYLPPTMPPPGPATLPGFLEHPAEVFDYYRKHHIARVVCEEKHRGERAVAIVCRDEAAARRGFGVEGEGMGVLLTRAGRRFFDGGPAEQELLGRLHAALGRAGWWERHRTGWVVLDAELMAWSEGGRAFRKLAPFHLLATERGLHTDRPHTWHLAELAGLCLADPEVLHATESLLVDPANPEEVEGAIRWWQGLTERGGAGMVVKPVEFIARGRRGIVQPGIKCRGPESLRIVGGPAPSATRHTAGPGQRSVAARRGLALRAFALGIEALERFVRGEPTRRAHECCFAILALQSKSVDPRL